MLKPLILRPRSPHFTSGYRIIKHALLVSREVVVNLIGNTTTKTGLNIQAKLDQNSYPIGQKISDDELSRVNLRRARFQGNWNYSILPNLNLEG